MPKKPTPIDFNKLQKDMEHIYQTVYTGNGSPSLTNQVTKLDGRITTLSDKIDNKLDNLETEMRLKFINIAEVVNEKFNNISYQIKQEFDKKRTENTHKWSFKTAITTSILASITSIVVILLTEFLKKV